ncbi:MAG: SH3 beta-barrel fold-containing protein [Candidatus Thorarchaeota archaeon]
MNPTNAETLRTRLNEGAVQFAFKKKNGDLRTAIGTTSLESIPLSDHPQGIDSSPESVITYYDLGKNAWRRVSIDKEIFIAE